MLPERRREHDPQDGVAIGGGRQPLGGGLLAGGCGRRRLGGHARGAAVRHQRRQRAHVRVPLLGGVRVALRGVELGEPELGVRGGLHVADLLGHRDRRGELAARAVTIAAHQLEVGELPAGLRNHGALADRLGHLDRRAEQLARRVPLLSGLGELGQEDPPLRAARLEITGGREVGDGGVDVAELVVGAPAGVEGGGAHEVRQPFRGTQGRFRPFQPPLMAARRVRASASLMS